MIENDARGRWMMSYDGERCLVILNDMNVNDAYRRRMVSDALNRFDDVL